MQRSINSLIGYTMGSTDGDIGKVEEFYFDDQTGTIRYLVVNTGGWLDRRHVLISPEALVLPWKEMSFPVNLTMDQVKNSPDISTDKPVSRQQEEQLYDYYTWNHYWGEGMYAMGSWGLLATQPTPDEMEKIRREREEKEHVDQHLRSTKEVTGYQLHATDGVLGEIEDFIVDEKWEIRFLVVDTGVLLPGRKVLISPDWIRRIDWNNSEVFVNHSVNEIMNSPEFDPAQPINEGYENRLFDYYGRPVEMRKDI